MHGSRCNMGNIFQVSHILQLLSGAFKTIAKYQKQGKYLLILHEARCDNYVIVKYLL